METKQNLKDNWSQIKKSLKQKVTNITDTNSMIKPENAIELESQFRLVLAKEKIK